MPVAPLLSSTENHPSNTRKKSKPQENTKKNPLPNYLDIHSEAQAMGIRFHQSAISLSEIMSEKIQLPFPEAEFLTCEEIYEPLFGEPFQNEPCAAPDENVTPPVEPLFGSDYPVECMINEPPRKPQPKTRKPQPKINTMTMTTTTKRKKRTKSSSCKTRITTTTSHTLPSGESIVTNRSSSSSESVNAPVTKNTARASRNGTRVTRKTKKRRPVSERQRAKNRACRLAAFTKFMDMMEHLSDSSSDNEDDEEEDEEEKEEKSIESIAETLTEMEQKKEKLKDSLDRTKETIEMLKSTKHEEDQAFSKMTEEQTQAKRKLDEAQKQWESISSKCYEKKIRVLELENEISENEQKIHSSRQDKRELRKTTINTGRDLLDQLLHPFKTKKPRKEPRHTVGSKRPRCAMDNEEPRDTEGGKGLKNHKFATKYAGSTQNYGRRHSLEETSTSSETDSEIQTDFLSSSSSSSFSEFSDSSNSSFGTENEAASTDHDLINAIRGRGDMPRSLQRLSEQDLAYALEKADPQLILALAEHIPESEEKLTMTGIVLNDSTCIHCGNFDQNFWNGRTAVGYICPDCTCGKCKKTRTQCRCGVFFTKKAYKLPVNRYVKRGMVGKNRMKKWTLLFSNENTEETLVDKFNRMRDTPKDDPNYHGRNGIVNSYKRWLRRYIVHCFTVKRLREFIYNICALNVYVERHKAHNPSCRPDHCVICSCRHVYENENRVPGSISTTGNGTSHRCCTACKNILSKTFRITFSWCSTGYNKFSDENEKYKRR